MRRLRLLLPGDERRRRRITAGHGDAFDVLKERGWTMESKAKFLGHPIHQMLIVFPFGLLATAVIFDILHFITNDGKWSGIAYYMIAAGVVGGLIAAVFGFIDWLAIPSGTRAKSIGLLHGTGNVIVVILFAASWFMRR